VRNTEVDQVIEPLNSRLEGSGRREGPHMEFVEDCCGQGLRPPEPVLPREC
jgi:hypothetical protein